MTDDQIIDISKLPDQTTGEPRIDVSKLPDNREVSKEDSDSLISKVWKSITEPINKPQTKGGFMDAVRAIPDVARSFVHDPIETAKNFGRGALEAVSPLDIATMASTGGESLAARAGLKSIASAMNMVNKGTSAVTAGQGLQHIFSPGSTSSQRVMGGFETAAGVLPFLHTAKEGEIADSVIGRSKVEMPKVEQPQVKGAKKEEDPIEQLETGSDTTTRVMDTADKISGGDISGNAIPNATLATMARKGMLSVDNIKGRIGAIEANAKAKYGDDFSKMVSPETQKLLTDLKDKLAANQGTSPSAIYIKDGSPDTIKKVMQAGYRFDSVRDDGAFRMVKPPPTPDNSLLPSQSMIPSGTPGVIPPGPEGAAKMMAGKKPDDQSLMMDILNFPKSVLASINFHAPLRQGLPLIGKKAYWTSLGDMFSAWKSEGGYKTIQDSIINDPAANFLTDKMGIRFTDLNSTQSREESMVSNLAEKIPGVRASNRAYSTFLNKLRLDTGKGLIQDAVKSSQKMMSAAQTPADMEAARMADPTQNDVLAKALGDFVNNATGRGSLKFGNVNLEKDATLLNATLFSPRLMASRVQMLNPANYLMTPPQVRREYLKSLLSVAGAGTTITQLGKLIPGATVESDPTSSDFGKLRIGNTRLDPYAGFQQYVVLANRLAQARSTSPTGKESDLLNPRGPYDPTYLSTITRFAENHANPAVTFALGLLNNGREINSGKKMNLTTVNPNLFDSPNVMDNSIAQRFIPIVIQDLYQIAREDPSLLPLMTVPAAFGASVQTYGGQ